MIDNSTTLKKEKRKKEVKNLTKRIIKNILIDVGRFNERGS